MRFLDVQRNRLRSVKQADDKSDCLYRIHGYPTVLNTYLTYGPLGVMDTDDGTFWLSSSMVNQSPWIELDLGAPKIIIKTRYRDDPGGASRATQFKIEASNDNANWYLVHTTAAGLAGGEYLFYVPGLKYRYWRWTALAGSGASGWAVWSLELFGPIA